MKRRSFIQKATLGGAGFLFLKDSFAYELGSIQPLPSLKGKKAIFVYGGWEGHEPELCRDIFVPWMRESGCEVTISDSLDIYTDKQLMDSLDFIVQLWTMGQIEKEQSDGLLEAVRRGVGIAGWHGGLGDSFRENTDYQFMVGGQWVAHPGGEIDYEVNITDHSDPITAELKDFKIHSEQYFMHVDPTVKFLATTTFTGEHADWIDGSIIPVIWKKVFGKGRVFYTSLGHNAAVFDIHEVLEIVKRGIRWVSGSLYESTPDLIRNVYPGKELRKEK